jgi:YVTN family beta-propeller protein
MNADRGNTGSTINPRRPIAAVTAAALAWLIAPTPVLALNAYITNYFTGDVSVIDTATNTVIATVPVGGGPSGVAVTPDGSRVYVTSGIGVSVIDTATNMVIGSPIPVESGAAGVAVTADGSRAYVSGIHFETVINTTTNTVVPPPIPVDALSLGSGIAVTPDGSKVYVARSSKLIIGNLRSRNLRLSTQRRTV